MKEEIKYSVFDLCKDLGIVRTVYTWGFVDYCRKHGVEIERVYNRAKTQHRLYISASNFKKFAAIWKEDRSNYYDRSTASYRAKDILMKKAEELK